MGDPRSAPIGLFDSGFGGLTVLREVMRLLPHEDLIYLGDTAHLPYGNKSAETILQYARENASFLLQKQIKLLIIPCNTACCHALHVLQQELPIPVIGVIEPGVQALLHPQSFDRVALLGTSSTIASGVYQKRIQESAPHLLLYPVACPLFVPLVEEGLIDHPATRLLAKHYLAPLQEQEIEAALLACTHYPLIAPLLQEILGPQVQLIEPAAACALQVKQILEEHHLLNPRFLGGRYEFFVTDDPEKFRRFAPLFLGQKFPETIPQVQLKKKKVYEMIEICNIRFEK